MKRRFAALAFLPLLAAAAPPPLPDIRPMVVVGSGTRITIRIRNQGTAPAPAGLVNVSLGNAIGKATNYVQPALAAGSTRSVIIDVGKPLAGVHYTVRTDVNQAIAESNEANNVLAGDF
ncbi:MAG TPA: CARDB domain-containing protein [Longimicrobium sp.]|nr:CARDB domain-containing protein [Longimicrobium sp.]